MSFPDNLLYTIEHEWIKIEDDTVVIGITDYAQDQLGDIVFIELPEIGTEVEEKKPIGVVESVKTVSDLYAPVSGKIKEVNEGLEAAPELVNSDPYGNGWIAKITIKDREELKNLLSNEEYGAHVAKEKQ